MQRTAHTTDAATHIHTPTTLTHRVTIRRIRATIPVIQPLTPLAATESLTATRFHARATCIKPRTDVSS